MHSHQIFNHGHFKSFCKSEIHGKVNITDTANYKLSKLGCRFHNSIRFHLTCGPVQMAGDLKIKSSRKNNSWHWRRLFPPKTQNISVHCSFPLWLTSSEFLHLEGLYDSFIHLFCLALAQYYYQTIAKVVILSPKDLPRCWWSCTSAPHKLLDF